MITGVALGMDAKDKQQPSLSPDLCVPVVGPMDKQQPSLSPELCIPVVYFDPKRCKDLLVYASKMRKSGIMTDYTIHIKDREFKVHKIVLASASKYFSCMFQFGGKDSNSLRADNFDPDVFSVILDFIYSGEIQLSAENVQNILVSANYLDIMYLKRECQKFMEAHLDDDNVPSAMKFASDFALEDLRKSCLQYFQKRIVSIIQKKTFLEMDPTFLRDILDEDEIHIGASYSQEEEIILKTVLTYISQKDIPEDLVPILLPVVRFPEITPSKVQRIVFDFENIRDLAILKYYTNLGEKVRRMVRMNVEVGEGFPQKWVKPRRTAHLVYAKSRFRYGVNEIRAKSLPFPKGFDAVNPHMEIDSISIWVRPEHEELPAVIGGLVVRYRPISMTQGHNSEVALEDDNTYYVSGKFKDSWLVGHVKLKPEEFITAVKIRSDDNFIFGMEFVTSEGRLLGFSGTTSIFENVEYSPDKRHCRLGAICCDTRDYLGDPVIVNLVLRWIHCAH